MIAEDLVRHFEDRVVALDGKAMVVCMSRRICVALYDEIIKLWPQWHSEDDAQGAIKIVMTGAPVIRRRGSSTSARKDVVICSRGGPGIRKIP